jgi:Polyketide cyclase / dehydrase and lipid transport
MLPIIAIAAGAAGVAIAGVLGLAARRPDTFRMQRSASINAPPETIYPLIADFRAWNGWSPWEKLEPGMDKTFSGAASGAGAVYAWAGKKVGEGRMEITSASPPSALTIKLDFLKPWKAHNTTTFTLQPRGGATEVTWAIEGPAPFINKVMGVVLNMDARIGKDFDSGLASLKAIAEGQAASS